MITAIRIDKEFTGEIIVENFGNLKTMCEYLGVSYSTYSKKKFPFKIGDIEVFKVPVKRGCKNVNKNL